MATAMTRFEVQIPLTSDPTQQGAMNTFLDNFGALCPFIYNPQYVYSSHDLSTGQYTALIYGLITAAQQATALGYLNTLNTAFATPVVCTMNDVTSEP